MSLVRVLKAADKLVDVAQWLAVFSNCGVSVNLKWRLCYLEPTERAADGRFLL